jgi:hypothetical protein
MPALAKSIQMTPTRSRRPVENTASLLQRIVIWARGSTQSRDGESRRPLERPFPFFGD